MKKENYFEITTIKRVEVGKKYYEIEQANGLCFCLDKKYGVVPKVGDTMAVRSWGGKWGQVMGVQINGKVAFDKTDADMEREHKEWQKNYHKEQWQEYYKVLEQIKDEESFETVDLSGMSGGYEVACQRMLMAGIKFLKEHSEFHFDYQTINGVYGICMTDTPWGKDLDKVLMKAVNGDCTGAMHQCVIGHLAQIHKHSIEWWLKQFPKKRRYTYPIELPKPKCHNPEISFGGKNTQ